MKKLILSALLVLSSSALFAQTKPDSVYHKVNWVETIGTKAEIQKEHQIRQNLKREYIADGFAFVATKENPKGVVPGKYLLFVKSK